MADEKETCAKKLMLQLGNCRHPNPYRDHIIGSIVVTLEQLNDSLFIPKLREYIQTKMANAPPYQTMENWKLGRDLLDNTVIEEYGKERAKINAMHPDLTVSCIPNKVWETWVSKIQAAAKTCDKQDVAADWEPPFAGLDDPCTFFIVLLPLDEIS